MAGAVTEPVWPPPPIPPTTGAHGSLSGVPPLTLESLHRPAPEVAPDLLGCLLLRRQQQHLRWGVIVETEAYCQSEPACHGHHRRSPSNETLFGEPGHFYVYISYGLHYCCNVVTDHPGWASGVLLRALDLPLGAHHQRRAAGPGLLCRCLGIDRSFDGRPVTDSAGGLWLMGRPPTVAAAMATGAMDLRQDQRIGISRGQELPWRWYLGASASISRRAPGHRRPHEPHCWSSAQLLEP